ncbi:MAG: Alpha amylase, GH13 family [Candidatus Ozemobacter sibiricus]|uniref:Alpha amylase, GH13 family n=1 Tax=Candidatus Ozemobacter sibiricus TaxID=2268124 RepID=A0A367ZSQ3_9BACT|nr:MAG: Alpha amylase, GH13 family [Candidatus Ozemobacter sibiricus]
MPFQAAKLVLTGVMLLMTIHLAAAEPDRGLMNRYDVARDAELRERAADWRNGAIVYQILVDRFAPPGDPQAKARFYQPPRVLKAWSELPRGGPFLEAAQVWAHEIEFWGGDLAGLQSRLDYLQQLGVEVVYLNPIFESFTNHKYDAWDYHKVDPAYGTREDLARLADDLHRRGMRLVLDGVFNHMGRQSPMFQDALTNPNSPWRDFFQMTPANGRGYVGWLDVPNLPELKLENPAVRDWLFGRDDSVVQSYLRREGIDGWRLDVAFDLGFRYLHDLTQAAHTAKPGSLVIGEIWNYPEEWHPSVDGVMNMHGRQILIRMLEGKLDPRLAAEMWETLIADAGMQHILKTWLVLDNHDTPRLATLLPEDWQQRMARVLQFTLPGSVCLYYGSEVGMTGGRDPEMRAPMRWDLVAAEPPLWRFHRDLIALRKREPALRYGDFRRLPAARTFAFLRRTNVVRQTVLVVANPGPRAVQEFIQVRDSKLMDVTHLQDQLSDQRCTVYSGCLDVKVPARTVLVLKPVTDPLPKGYNRYDRIY